jgi:hypothetical protein
MAPTVAGPSGALAGPEERLVNLLLRDVAELDLLHHGIDKIYFRF